MSSKEQKKNKDAVEIFYFQVSMKVQHKNIVAFQRDVKNYLEEFNAEFGWELVNAAYHITGAIDTVVHTWRLPNDEKANAVYRVMTHAVESAKYREIQGLIDSTTQDLTAAMDYDPILFGFQNETIVLDCNKAGWKLSHKTLDEFEINISEEECSGEIQALSRNGSLSASLATEDHQNLLFNLAQIRSKSNFQWPEQEQAQADNAEAPNVLQAERGPAFPEKVKNFYLLTPWGKNYKFDSSQLEKAGEYMKPEELQDDERIKGLLDAEVSLASIPEQRDSVPGEGSMCYIINLASFDKSAK